MVTRSWQDRARSVSGESRPGWVGFGRRPGDPRWRLRHRGSPKYLDVPEVGFFRLRLVTGGPYVPALIYAPCPFAWEPEHPAEDLGWGVEPLRAPVGMQRWTMMALANEQEIDPLTVWQRGERIDARGYHQMVAAKRRAEHHAPHEPEANPRERIDLRRQPSLF